MGHLWIFSHNRCCRTKPVPPLPKKGRDRLAVALLDLELPDHLPATRLEGADWEAPGPTALMACTVNRYLPATGSGICKLRAVAGCTADFVVETTFPAAFILSARTRYPVIA